MKAGNVQCTEGGFMVLVNMSQILDLECKHCNKIKQEFLIIP